jgi:uncharacterized repeat protein (TIGR01451 family)
MTLNLLGSRRPAGTGAGALAAHASRFVGPDPKQWKSGAPLFSRVRFPQVYPGVDLVYYGNDGEIEHDFLVAAGADPGRIRLAFDGADSVSLSAAGDILLTAGGRTMTLHKPVAYQDREGTRREVAAAWALDASRRASFQLGPYDRDTALVIDPVITYSTYLGGADNFDNGNAVAYDAAGFVYVMGSTTNFPVTAGAYDTAPIGIDVFVAKMDARQTGAASLVWATYLGGTGAIDAGTGLAVDAAGNVYVSVSNGGGYPTTAGAYDTTYNSGTSDVGITKINPSGSALVWSTYLGGGGADAAPGLAIDLSGAVVVGGGTTSVDFPTTPTAYQPTPAALQDAFLSVISPNGEHLTYSTFFGGSGSAETINGVALDGQGRCYVGGYTNSTDLPTNVGAFDRTLGGTLDGFVARFDPLLPGSASLAWSTYYGGSGSNDNLIALALAPGNEPVVAGNTNSADLPGTSTGFDTTLTGSDDLFVARLSNDGSSVPYATYLGGTGSESMGADSLAVDDFGRAHVGGLAAAADFPQTAGPIVACSGTNTLSYSLIDTNVSGAGSLVESTCVGPAWGLGIGIDTCGNAGLTGFTTSAAYPVVNGLDATNDLRDAFLAQITSTAGGPAADVAVSVTDAPDPILAGETVTHTVSVTNNGPNPATGVRVVHRMSSLVILGTISGQCSGSGAFVTCDLGTIGSGATVPLAIEAMAPVAGALWAETRVSATSTDPDCSDNGASTLTTVANPVLNVTSPNGGSVLASGAPTTITWTAPAAAVAFNLDYSITNGSKWKSIVKGVGGRSYGWTVPATKNNKPASKVRITSYDAAAKKLGTDTSDAAFTIEVVRVNSPNGGESLTSGTIASITWSSNATVRPVTKVKLQYSTSGGSKWKTITTILTGNPGTYDWTVPVFAASMPNCKVRVTLQDGAGSLAKDDSNATFTMHP